MRPMIVLGILLLSATIPAAPTITLEPSARSIRGTIQLNAKVVGVKPKSVDFLVDGAQLARVSKAPFQFDWDSRKFKESVHELSAQANLKPIKLQVLEFPPRLQKNSVWRVSFGRAGDSNFQNMPSPFKDLLNWTITFDQQKDNTAMYGNAVSIGQDRVKSKNAVLWLSNRIPTELNFEISRGIDGLRCVFNQNGIKGLSITGIAYQTTYELGTSIIERGKECTLTLIRAGNSVIESRAQRVLSISKL